jgi:hypothetical protein
MTADEFPWCDWCDQTLFYVSLVGIALSMVGLLVSIFYDLTISFMSKSETNKLTANASNQLLSQCASMSKQFLSVITTWCFSILAMNVFYIVFAVVSNKPSTYDELKTQYKTTCITVGVFLHYFLLSSFFFSFSITVVQYILLVKMGTFIKYIYWKAVVFSFGKYN